MAECWELENIPVTWFRSMWWPWKTGTSHCRLGLSKLSQFLCQKCDNIFWKQKLHNNMILIFVVVVFFFFILLWGLWYAARQVPRLPCYLGNNLIILKQTKTLVCWRKWYWLFCSWKRLPSSEILGGLGSITKALLILKKGWVFIKIYTFQYPDKT